MSILSSSKSIGDSGEELVRKHLVSQGFFIITQNFHSPFGEIDIVARDKKRLYFVEVKIRRSSSAGFPEDFVTKEKIRKIRLTISSFLSQNKKFSRLEKEILVGAVVKVNDEFKIEMIPVE